MKKEKGPGLTDAVIGTLIVLAIIGAVIYFINQGVIR